MTDQWSDMEARAAEVSEDFRALLADARRLRAERDEARRVAEEVWPWYPGASIGQSLPWRRPPRLNTISVDHWKP